MAETAMDASGGDRDRPDDTTGADVGKRDYGDSAGYGGGGSTLDYDELLGEENSPRDLGRPNPLDAVVHTGPGAEESGSGGDDSTDRGRKGGEEG